jgi:thioesterase domain-containing protein
LAISATSAERSLPPFFCVHPVGGAVFCYLELARRLGPDQPFYGVEARGLAPGEEPGESVEEMAARYLAAVRAVQPSGPYRLGGWSFGGLVAFEMARQLATAGEETALLALFDPTPLAPRPTAGGPDDLAALALLARDLGGLAGRSIPLPLALASEPDGAGGADGDHGLDLLLASARKAGALPPDAGRAQMRRLARLYAAHLRAAERYRPASLDLPCDLFLPERSGPRPGLSWERDAAPGSRTHRVGGDHYGLLRAPHVEDLARRLHERLDAVRPR